MKVKDDPRKPQRLLLFTHTLLWLIGWGFGIHFAAVSTYNGSLISSIILFFWTLVFILHCLFYATSASRADAHERERKAYREGFSDALRHLQKQDDFRYEPIHMLDEDGELTEWEPEGKRKRGEQ